MIRFTDFNRQVEVDGTTLREALDLLVKTYPSLRPVLCDGDGAFRPHHRLIRDGKPLDPANATQILDANDRVHIFTAVVGG